MIPTTGTGYDFVIDWGDGTLGSYSGTTPNPTHTYTAAGDHKVTIMGSFPRFYMNNNATYKNKLIAVNQWGAMQRTSMQSAFYGCSNLQILATDTPDLSQVTNMQYMLYGTTNLTGNFSGWDTSNVTVMSVLFGAAIHFNQDLSTWDVSNVTDMSNMFVNATNFNQDLSTWDTSKVTTMQQMFNGATDFNGDVSTWDVSNVTTMLGMFNGAANFNGDLSNWDVSKVTLMPTMFQSATLFNSDLSNWDVSKVTNMMSMFNSAKNFTSDLSGWDVSKVTTMQAMFNNANSFTSDLSGRDVGNVTTMFNMFSNATLFNSNLSGWDTSKVTTMQGMFNNASNFNQDLSTWDVTKVTTMTNMLNNTALSTYNYNAILNGRSKQNVLNNVVFRASPTKYGGCEVNGPAGIAGHNKLISDKGWTITDGGLAGCAVTASVAYVPSTATNTDVTATLTLNMTGSVTLSGRTQVNATTFTKVYTGNDSETVTFESIYGYTGDILVEVTRIDKTPPTCSIDYTPTTDTNQDVVAALTGCSEAVIVTNTSFTPCQGGASEVSGGLCTFTGNDTFTFNFTDAYGNT